MDLNEKIFFCLVNPIHVQNLISLAALTGGNSMSPSGKLEIYFDEKLKKLKKWLKM